MDISIETLVKNNVHLGTLLKKANPKTREYWFGDKNSMVVFNPELVQEQLEHARKKFQSYRAEKKDILVICEKSLYADEIEKLSKETGFHYLNYRVPSGILTNFDTLMGRIKSMNEMRSLIDSEDFVKYTKKEQSMKKRKLQKIEKVYKGVKNLKKKPDYVLVVDGALMLKFVSELEKMKVDNSIIATSNFPRWRNKDNLVVGNVDSYKSLDFMLQYIIK